MNTTTTSNHTQTASTRQHQTTGARRTENLTFETPLLLVALAAFIAMVLALPEIALLLLGVPAAVALGVATMTSVARLLAR